MDPATRALLNSIGLLVLSTALSFLAARYWFQRNKAEAEAKRLADEVMHAKKIADEDRRKTNDRVATRFSGRSRW